MADASRTRLGKGLSALLGEPSEPTATAEAAEAGVRAVPVARCTPNPRQPRDRFDPDAARALAQSVRERGVLQPILVTPDDQGGYRIVAGERRWRAAQAAGLETIPALVRELAPREMLEIALIENLQREDLNAIEEARGYRRLQEEFGLGTGAIAEGVGRDRSTVANALRLLDLPPAVQDLVEQGRLAAGHARPLLGLPEPGAQIELAREAASRGMSARQVEARVRRLRTAARARPAQRARSAQVRSYEDDLQRALGTRVRIVERGRGAGTIEVAFHSSEEFERLHALLARGR